MIKPERKGQNKKEKEGNSKHKCEKDRVHHWQFFFFVVPLSHLFWNSQIGFKYIIYRFTWRVKTVSKEKRLLNIRKIAFCSIWIPVKMTISENWVELNTTGKSVAHPTTPDIKKTPQNRPKMYGKVRVYNNRCSYLLRLICLFILKKG